MRFLVEVERENDGRWIAGVRDLPGVHVYGGTEAEALTKVQALALSVLADEIEHGERDGSTLLTVTFESARAA